MTDQNNSNPGPSFEQSFASEIAREFLKEQRRHRRWGIFF